MSETQNVDKIMDRIIDKLDLLLELTDAQKAEDWDKVNEVCEKLDALKKVPVEG
jgi:hypothetical protein